MEKISTNDLDILNNVIRLLSQLEEDSRIRVLKAALTFLGISMGELYGNHIFYQSPTQIARNEGQNQTEISFMDKDGLSPKEFLLEKKPKTNIERVACLAYFLTHYRNKPHFKTIDLSSLNTEAAQPKFSNAAQVVKDATRRGLIVPAVKGMKQISALGEQYVEAMPEEEAVRKVARLLSRQQKRRSPNKIQKNVEAKEGA